MVIYYFYAILSVCIYATLPSIIKHMNVPTFTFIGIASTSMGLISLLIASQVEKKALAHQVLSPTSWGPFALYIGLNFIGYLLYVSAAKKIPVLNFELIGICSPVIAGTIGYFLLKEETNSNQALGFCLMTAGLLIALKKQTA